MEKSWAVEVWGDWPLGVTTEIFYSKSLAQKYFLDIRRKLDSSKYIITRDSIVDVKDSSNAIYLTNLDELE